MKLGRLLAGGAAAALAVGAACSAPQPFCPQTLASNGAVACPAPQPDRPPDWTAGARPFDLVWDKCHADFNGLPLDPRWAAQRETGAPPDYEALGCATASDHCSSQAPASDTPERANPAKARELVAGECELGAVFPGHLNWGVAAYRGRLRWGEYSWSDGDYNLDLETADGAGVAGAATSVLLEFAEAETADRWGTSWWRGLKAEVDSATETFRTKGFYRAAPPRALGDRGGYKAVAIGLLGLDGVHGAQAELHPVFALAVRTRCDPQGESAVRETWQFFLRNEGGEGDCASHRHYWDRPPRGQPPAPHFVELPWPPGAACVVVEEGSWAPWQEGDLRATVEVAPDWTLLRVALPDRRAGVDGAITLVYAAAQGSPAPSCDDDAAPRRPRAASEFERRFPDATERRQVLGELLSIPRPTPPAGCRAHEQRFDGSIDAHAAVDGPAQRGALSRPATEPMPNGDAALKEQREEVLRRHEKPR